MVELNEGVSDLDARLAEIDRRLRDIQAEIAPDQVPRETTPPQARHEESPGEEVAPGVEAVSGPENSPTPQQESAPAPPPRGRSGPLASLLQRVSREGRPPASEVPLPPIPDPQPDPVPEPRPDPEPMPGPATAPPTPDSRIAELSRQCAALAELHVQLVSSLRDLLEGYGRVIAQSPAPMPASPSPSMGAVTISAGPFTSLEALRAFERALAAIPGVREVTIRGYEGENRAIVDVTLGEKS
jgi:hypothetical protein